MRIGLDVSSMQHIRWRNYAVRFVFGGIVTALTGLIARRYGPGVGGLFLAFPAIFPGRGYVDREAREGEKAASRFRWHFKRQSCRRHRCSRSGDGGSGPDCIRNTDLALPAQSLHPSRPSRRRAGMARNLRLGLVDS